MKFHKPSCMEFLVGYFVLGELLTILFVGYTDNIIYPLFHAILGILMSIGVGYIVGGSKNG